MLAQFTIWPEQASAHASQVDDLFFFILACTGGAFVLVLVLVTLFSFLYQRRSDSDVTPRILGSHELELMWTLIPLVLFLVMFVWGVKVYNVPLNPPPDAMEVFVSGKQWMWKIQHPNGQREINALHIPVNQPVKLKLISEDVIHDFAIPAFRNKVDVIPGRYVNTWYLPTKIGTYHIFCDQYCGQGHAAMVGTCHVMSQEDYEKWSSGYSEGSLALEGRKLFLKLQCLSCHSNDSGARAPVLEGIYGTRVPLQGGRSVLVDEAYIRESILNPRAKIHEGWTPVMPTYKGQVSEEDLWKVISYIKTLGRGDTPKRTEEFPAPIGAPQEFETSPGNKKVEEKQDGKKDENKGGKK